MPLSEIVPTRPPKVCRTVTYRDSAELVGSFHAPPRLVVPAAFNPTFALRTNFPGNRGERNRKLFCINKRFLESRVVQTYPLCTRKETWHSALDMFLRCHRRTKEGKEHRYYSVEESRRLQSGKVVQRRVLYLGEINESQQAAWRKTLEVFDEQQRATTSSGEELHVMLMNMLVDRLQLKFHQEKKEMRMYALTVGQGGPKLTAHEATNGGEPWIDVAQAKPPPDPQKG